MKLFNPSQCQKSNMKVITKSLEWWYQPTMDREKQFWWTHNGDGRTMNAESRGRKTFYPKLSNYPFSFENFLFFFLFLLNINYWNNIFYATGTCLWGLLSLFIILSIETIYNSILFIFHSLSFFSLSIFHL